MLIFLVSMGARNRANGIKRRNARKKAVVPNPSLVLLPEAMNADLGRTFKNYRIRAPGKLTKQNALTGLNRVMGKLYEMKGKLKRDMIMHDMPHTERQFMLDRCDDAIRELQEKQEKVLRLRKEGQR